MATVGLGLVIFMFIVAAFADQISLHDPVEVDLTARLAPLSANHPFGTDNFGRDIFSRVVYGARISIFAGTGSVGIGLLFGITLGAVSGYAGGKFDNVVMRFMDAIMAFPGILLAIAMMTALGASLLQCLYRFGIRFVLCLRD